MRKISSEVLKSVFKRRGENGDYTMLFDEFISSIKEGMLSEVNLRETEQPVIAGIKTEEDWFLITDERLMLFKENKLEILRHTDIKDVSLDIGLNIRFGARQKNEFSGLGITTFSGQKVLLKTEQGQPFMGIWNVLKTIAARNS